MPITGLSFEAEQFWPFMFAEDDGSVYLAVGKWHTSIVRLDGLDTVRRVDLGRIEATKEDLARAAVLRDAASVKNKLRSEVDSSIMSVEPSTRRQTDGPLAIGRASMQTHPFNSAQTARI